MVSLSAMSVRDGLKAANSLKPKIKLRTEKQESFGSDSISRPYTEASASDLARLRGEDTVHVNKLRSGFLG